MREYEQVRPELKSAFSSLSGFTPTSFIGAPGVHAPGSAHYERRAVDVVPQSFGADYNPQAWDALTHIVLSGKFNVIGAAKEYVDKMGPWAAQHGVRMVLDDPRYSKLTTGYHFHLEVP